MHVSDFKIITAQKIKFSIKDFFSKCEQIYWKLRFGPYEILIRTDLDLIRKISTNIVSVLIQKLGFRL